MRRGGVVVIWKVTDLFGYRTVIGRKVAFIADVYVDLATRRISYFALGLHSGTHRYHAIVTSDARRQFYSRTTTWRADLGEMDIDDAPLVADVENGTVRAFDTPMGRVLAQFRRGLGPILILNGGQTGGHALTRHELAGEWLHNPTESDAGLMGETVDLLFDPATFRITHLLVETDLMAGGHQVVLPIGMVSARDADIRRLHVDVQPPPERAAPPALRDADRC